MILFLNSLPKNMSISRVQIHLDDERLKFVPVRKDEGFESDSEGSAGSVCEETCCSSNEIKVNFSHFIISIHRYPMHFCKK